ncbi:MAG: hypothetical protein QF718_08225 [Phycisphaerales bacterium]|nr:hypothetical protein [Phycisphaerales bacterium]
MSLITHIIVKLTLLIVITAMPTIAVAQGGGFSRMMSAGGNTPDYMLRDLQRFDEALNLTDEQVMIVEQILRDYDESFREMSEANQEGIGASFQSMRGDENNPARQRSQELRTKSRELREKLESTKKLGDEEGIGKLQEKLNKELESIREEMRQNRVEQLQSPESQTAFEEAALLMQDQLRIKKQMREEFEADLEVILTEDQQEFWPPLKRQLLRDRLLPRGRLSGEKVDVMSLVEQQDYDDDTLLQLLPAISEWDTNVTTALSTRDNHMVENQGVLMLSMRTLDIDSGISVMKAQAKLAEAVRDLNDLAIENIVMLLPEEEAKQFDAYAKNKGYPRIYRPTRTDRAFKAAMEIEDLDSEILEAINEIYEAMTVDIAYANEQIYSATHRWESQEQIDRMNRFAQRMSGGSSERTESPMKESEDHKRDVEEDYLNQLRMLLTEEQIEMLGGLEKRTEREGGQDRWGGNRGSADSNRGGNRGFEGGREEFMNRFDKDGNGEISEEERQAIRDHFRNGGVHGGGGSDGGGRP